MDDVSQGENVPYELFTNATRIPSRCYSVSGYVLAAQITIRVAGAEVVAEDRCLGADNEA